MYRILIYLVLASLAACNSERPRPPITTEAPPQVVSVKFSKTDGDCNQACASFSAETPVVASATHVHLSDSVQAWVENTVRDEVNVWGETTAKKYFSLAQLADSVLYHWRTDDADQVSYTIEITDSVLALTPRYVSLRLDAYLNFGGAHPNFVSTLATFDVTSGKQLSKRMVIRDEVAICKLLEAAYRLEKKEAFDNGFAFEGGKITFPHNFALTAQGIVFHYNTYEVAAYVLGDFQTLLTWSQLGAAAVNPYP